MLDLPDPDVDALERSARLAALIGSEITAAGGWLPFYRYMERALYAPGFGYYTGGAEKFGAGGDFVTAPGLTPLFGQALAAQIEEIMRASAREVLEIGAGDGHLAVDVLCELEARDYLPQAYGILELSAELRARQRETLFRDAPQLAARVHWLDTLPEAFSGAALANEALDAMPLHVITVKDGRVRERGVARAAAGAPRAFVWEDRPAQGAVLEAARRLPLPMGGEGEYITEINLAAAAWISAWGERLRQGALL
ncbi:MAG: SAM-dependent methyltransferase, partial [Azoarcus sp.]|nr:SAM-dependent methyltransferase [Azoarcus sp.]